MFPFRPLLASLALLAATGLHAAENPKVLIKTSAGDMIAELYPDKAPKTVENFLSYVQEGYYNGTIFHRSINNFMIQGGGFTPDLAHKQTHAPIPTESANGLKNDLGSLAMARGYEPDSATSQFFINLSDNKHLNYFKPEPGLYGQCVFGKIVKGLDVAKKIGAVPTGPAGHFESDVPLEKVVIEEISFYQEPPAATPQAAPQPAAKPAAQAGAKSGAKSASKPIPKKRT